ncbi:MAG: hypothetical protein JO230_09455 [Xanthobacteraceae bacterium]|nr:hypothetical protein [Xanthobacteraceae bacterium]
MQNALGLKVTEFADQKARCAPVAALFFLADFSWLLAPVLDAPAAASKDIAPEVTLS